MNAVNEKYIHWLKVYSQILKNFLKKLLIQQDPHLILSSARLPMSIGNGFADLFQYPNGIPMSDEHQLALVAKKPERANPYLQKFIYKKILTLLLFNNKN